jgi:hypothetical protein
MKDPCLAHGGSSCGSRSRKKAAPSGPARRSSTVAGFVEAVSPSLSSAGGRFVSPQAIVSVPSRTTRISVSAARSIGSRAS